ncbi:peptidase dimerization domain-containing protein [Cryobacterium sp. SO1]|uniref:peptidase dimerization domain-containing protein n=1 Tax=Cryobacterium sp. SO1 TaxID=1897061 RepID=UPI0010EF0317|nr:peptidase dimerization domain-containing protein [Cryobacterium sp. SO1]RZI34789.1 N-acyl-L-amino acid amidohydrolase [Cryobacterium sp. SO1]
MAEDSLFDRIPRPAVVLGQHVSPLPAGVLAVQPGLAFAAADGIRITLHGRGGHGSRPETTVDPIVMAAATVLRLQTIVSREIAATESLVLTIGSLHAGTKNNIIPDTAELLISMRSFDTDVRDRAITAIRRIAVGKSNAAGASHEATVDVYESFPAGESHSILVGNLHKRMIEDTIYQRTGPAGDSACSELARCNASTTAESPCEQGLSAPLFRDHHGQIAGVRPAPAPRGVAVRHSHRRQRADRLLRSRIDKACRRVA